MAAPLRRCLLCYLGEIAAAVCGAVKGDPGGGERRGMRRGREEWGDYAGESLRKALRWTRKAAATTAMPVMTQEKG